MENYPFDTAGLSCDVIDLYHDTYLAVKAKMDVHFTGNIDFQLEQFEEFRAYSDISIRGSFAIKQSDNNDCYLLFVEGQLSASTLMSHVHHDVHQFQTWAVAFLKNDFDRVLIRRETLADKIIELVHPVELDFDDDKPFSDTFYVLVNDRNKALRAIDRNFRNAVMDVRTDNFVIEIVGHTLIIGSHDQIMPERAVHLAEFVERICKGC